jgi:hypothetical protein
VQGAASITALYENDIWAIAGHFFKIYRVPGWGLSGLFKRSFYLASGGQFDRFLQ